MRGKSCALGALLLLAACGTGEGGDGSRQPSAPATPAASAGAGTGASVNAAPAKAFAQKETIGDNGKFEFAYAWPAEVSAIPPLAARLDAERKAAFAEQKAQWDEAQKEMPADCISCRSRAYDKKWLVVADLPRWLSLSATHYGYTGGAHGGTVYDAIVWDRDKGAGVKPVDMFRSATAIDRAVQARFCDLLDEERGKRRGKPVVRSSEWSTDCIAPVANSTVIVGSKGGRAFDRIGFLIPAYNAGAYAEGTYEITLPMTPALLDAVKPEYRRAFVVP